MESTEKCEVVIQHFNGKYLKTPPGIPGESPLLCFTIHSHHSFPFFLGKSSHFTMRNLLSNSIIVIFHLVSAGQHDRLCTPLFLPPEASCCSCGWIADGCTGPLLSLCLFLCHIFAGWNFSGRRKLSLNIYTHNSVLFFAIYLRACTRPFFLWGSYSPLLCPLSFPSIIFLCSHPRQWTIAKDRTAREKRMRERMSQNGDRCKDKMILTVC